MKTLALICGLLQFVGLVLIVSTIKTHVLPLSLPIRIIIIASGFGAVVRSYLPCVKISLTAKVIYGLAGLGIIILYIFIV